MVFLPLIINSTFLAEFFRLLVINCIEWEERSREKSKSAFLWFSILFQIVNHWWLASWYSLWLQECKTRMIYFLVVHQFHLWISLDVPEFIFMQNCMPSNSDLQMFVYFWRTANMQAWMGKLHNRTRKRPHTPCQKYRCGILYAKCFVWFASLFANSSFNFYTGTLPSLNIISVYIQHFTFFPHSYFQFFLYLLLMKYI